MNMEAFYVDLFNKVALPIILAVAIAVLKPLTAKLTEWLESRINSRDYQLIQDALRVGVQAAEKSLPGKTGAEKKAFALGLAQSFLDRYGIGIDAGQLASTMEGVLAAEEKAQK